MTMTIKKRFIELLAPARNLACGLAAVDHGADAVYIGAPRFGARAAATNTTDDIGQLVAYAHRFGVKIYVTLNTILRDDELQEATEMVWQLYRLGVDALIVQDMSLLRLPLPPIPLHASTQMDNRTVEKVQFLAEAGFRQVVLARELSLQQIRAIHEAVPQVALEVFVHGALCVSYSGQCYASEACFGRSANRGECAQFCRLPFSLVDAEGRVMSRDKHLLSLRDMNRMERLEELLDAGVTSLKIEGRLKEVSYVKNVTAAYRHKLDELFARRREYQAAAWGRVNTTFTPQADKSFSRGFTTYFLDGRGEEVASMDTPKSMGEQMGTLKEQRQGFVTVAGVKPFHNGDGACYIDERGQMQGFRINRVENGRLYPSAPLPRIKPRTPIFRNYDQEFEKLLDRKSAERKMALRWSLWDVATGFVLEATDETGRRAALLFQSEKQRANTPQSEPIRRQLMRLGDTPYEVREPMDIRFSQPWFIPSSQLAEWRRKVLEALERVHRVTYPRELQRIRPTTHPWLSTTVTYAGNVMNREARRFYEEHGVQQVAPAYEQQPVEGALLMRCKHCLRYTMGWCPTRQKGRSPFREPYYLVSNDGRRFQLRFDCKACEMQVVKSS
ncbi:MAG: U32 family peptidase [Bacteroides sp.]